MLNRYTNTAVKTLGATVVLSGINKLIGIYQGYNQFLQLLNDIKEQSQSCYNDASNLVTSLKIEEINPLLQLYPSKDKDKINKLENKLDEIKKSVYSLQRVQEQLKFIEIKIAQDGFLEKTASKNLSITICYIQHQFTLTSFILKIGELFCETYLYRLNKQYALAKNSVDVWLETIKSYKDYLNKNKILQSESLINSYLINAYNHKAKIHRALAGHDIEKLDQKEMELAYASYQSALAIKKDKIILNGLGFLLSDFANSTKDFNEKLTRLKLAVSYHEQALIIDNQDPNTYHGFSYALYQVEKYHHTHNQIINHETLNKALAFLTFIQMKNPNPRIFLDKALIFLLVNDQTNALENLNQGLILDPNHALLRYHRGCLFLKKGNVVTAMEDLRYGKMKCRFSPID